MPPRIVGTELEYGTLLFSDEGCWNLGGLSPHSLYDATPREYRGQQGFLPNGGRFYLDLGHPEYATPECLSLDDVLASECAGDIITYETVGNIAAAFDRQVKRPLTMPVRYAVNRRVSDHGSEVWGYHENYSYAARTDRRRLFANLAIHLATRTLYCGAGALNGKGEFVISQKGQAISTDVDFSTLNKTKPLLSTRQEHHADDKRWRRANVVGGDPNMSPWATRLKLGSTMLVMDMVDRGYDCSDFMPVWGAAHLARQVAGDLSMRKTVKLQDGRKVLPLDIQYALYSNAKKMADDGDLDVGDEKLMVLDEWERALADLESGSEGLLDRADWPKRLQVLQAYADKHDLRPGSQRLFEVDRMWDSLDPAAGIGLKLRKGLWRRWMPDEELVERRLTEPPQDTRAAIRGRYLSFVRGRPELRPQKVDWSKVTVPGPVVHNWLDPFATSDKKTDKYMWYRTKVSGISGVSSVPGVA